MGTDLYKQGLGSIPPVSRLWRVAPDAQKSPVPNWERGTGGRSTCPSLIGDTVGSAILRSIFSKLRAAWTAPSKLFDTG